MFNESENDDLSEYYQSENEKLQKTISAYGDVIKHLLRFVSNVQPDRKINGTIESNILKQTDILADDISYLDAELRFHRTGDVLDYDEMNQLEHVPECTDEIEKDRKVYRTIRFGLAFDDPEIGSFREKTSIYKYEGKLDKNLYFTVTVDHNDGTGISDSVQVMNDDYFNEKEILKNITRPGFRIKGLSYSADVYEPVNASNITSDSTVYVFWDGEVQKQKEIHQPVTDLKRTQRNCTVRYDSESIQIMNQDNLPIHDGEEICLDANDSYSLFIEAPNGVKYPVLKNMELKTEEVQFRCETEPNRISLSAVTSPARVEYKDKGIMATERIIIHNKPSLPRDFGRYCDGLWSVTENDTETVCTLDFIKKSDDYNITYDYGDNKPKYESIQDPDDLELPVPDGFLNSNNDRIKVFEKWTEHRKSPREIVYTAEYSEFSDIKKAIYRIIELGYVHNLSGVKHYIRFPTSAKVDPEYINGVIEEMIAEKCLTKGKSGLLTIIDSDEAA